VATPVPIANRPGLPAIAYRVGEHGSFLATMKARLSSSDRGGLERLTARTPDDPSIALLDAWATVGDVLTFYQERLANEGYLGTATERRSVLELARLIGYSPRPGVSASAYLAYTIDENMPGPAEIPAGSRSQSLPGPGELPQSFETSETLVARREWNAITPRLQRPQTVESILEGTDDAPGARIYLEGASTNVKVNDVLLVTGTGLRRLFRASEVVVDSAADRTLVALAPALDAGTLLPSGETQIRRAAREAERSAASGRAVGPLAASVLAKMVQALGVLNAVARAQPLPDDIALVVRNRALVETMLAPLLAIVRLVDAGIGGALLADRAQQPVADIGRLAHDAIEELTGLPDGGRVGLAMTRLAESLEDLLKEADEEASPSAEERISAAFSRIVNGLAVPTSVPPRNQQSLERDPAVLFDPLSDLGTRAVAALQPSIADRLATASARASIAGDTTIRAYVFRQHGLLFGATAPRKVTSVSESGVVTTSEWTDADIIAAEDATVVHLDAISDRVVPGSFVVLDFTAVGHEKTGRVAASQPVLLARAGAVSQKVARAVYGVSGQSTRVPLVDESGQAVTWLIEDEGRPETPAFHLIRRANVYAVSEELALAEMPMEADICGHDQWIETSALLSGLEAGRWLIVSGERADVPGTSGVRSSELVMLGAVRNAVETVPVAGDDTARRRAGDDASPFLDGDAMHTYLQLATPLAYCYRRSTVAINANVVAATHGETRAETLGAGDGAETFQAFTLRQPPLTYVSSPEPDGIASTLHVYVNGVEWRESEALVALGPGDRAFVTRIEDDGKTLVVFGDGVHGARVPTGVENVKAVYRSGIGKGGNVKAGQISQLMSRPLGAKAVVNPFAASGGADRETRDQARKNAPLAVKALDRLVSVSDYADFARTFAGVGKAQSARLVAGGVESVFVTIAGTDDIPIATSGDLYRNLLKALRDFGDPYIGIRVAVRELLLLVLEARLEIAADYAWEDVVDRTRSALLDAFGFERAELGVGLALSRVVAVIQSVRGVLYVDVDALGAVTQIDDRGALRSPQELAAAMQGVVATARSAGRPAPFVPVAGARVVAGTPRPAQIAFFSPELPETLILNRAGARA
jgi:hypothetical protein